MYAQFFGNYLLSHGVVTREQLLETMHRKSSTKIKLGTLAIHAGYMTANEVDRIVILQTHEDKRFGELAIHEGYLTEEEIIQIAKIAKEVKPDFVKTSTGFGPGGATAEAVKLMKHTVGDVL